MRAFSRRRFLAFAGASPFTATVWADRTHDSPGELARAEIWNRFLDRRFNLLLHYAGLKGEVVLPTAEDCREAKPNGMSWSTPIEDGPFFGGLFLDGLCNRWRSRRDEESAGAARTIAAGLMVLAGFSKVPGFIPRGIGADGDSFYPASSEDQVFPWFYGLWSYLGTELPETEERTRIKAKLIETGHALAAHQWRVPCNPPEFGYRGDFLRPVVHDIARLFFLLRAMEELTGEKRWREEYRRRLDELIGKEPRPRRDYLAEGLDFEARDGGNSRLWTHSMSQAALRVLSEIEDDPVTREVFRAALLASALRAVPYLEHGRAYDRDNELSFEVDWRFLNAAWKPQANCDEAIALGRAQLPLWAERNPRSPWEDETMREPLFAAWMVLLANDPELKAAHSPAISELMGRYDWTGFYTASFFIAVNLEYESARETLG